MLIEVNHHVLQFCYSIDSSSISLWNIVTKYGYGPVALLHVIYVECIWWLENANYGPTGQRVPLILKRTFSKHSA